MDTKTEKPGILSAKKKTNLKSDQNRKTEKPNVPLIMHVHWMHKSTDMRLCTYECMRPSVRPSVRRSTQP